MSKQVLPTELTSRPQPPIDTGTWSTDADTPAVECHHAEGSLQ